MIMDSLWLFTGGAGGVGNNDGATDSPTTGTQNSSNVIDVGVVSGLPASTAGGGGGGARDLGIGDDPALKLMVVVKTLFAGGTSLSVAVAGAPDSGTGTPGTYVTMATGPVVVEANLIAGARLFDVDMPRVAPAEALPRYYRLSYVTVGTHTAGAIEGIFVLDRIDQVEQSNATLGGYPVGITIAN